MRAARCPGCSLDRDVDAQSALRTAEAAFIAREKAWSLQDVPDDCFRALAMQNLPNWFWACDACIESGQALVADVRDVNVSMGAPFAAYIDRPFTCEDCHVAAVFSAAEQKHWFETLRFLIWVYPKQCAACRAKRRSKKRAHAALAEALANLDSTDLTQLEAVARLYDEIGSAQKAATFRARAKNRKRS